MASSLSLIFLLLISISCMAAAQSPSPSLSLSPSASPSQSFREAQAAVVSLPIPYFNLFPPKVNDPTIRKCVESVENIPNCASDVLISFLTGIVRVSGDCCNQVLIGGRCIGVIFPFISFNPSFGGLINDFCGGSGGAVAADPPPPVGAALPPN